MISSTNILNKQFTKVKPLNWIDFIFDSDKSTSTYGIFKTFVCDLKVFIYLGHII